MQSARWLAVALTTSWLPVILRSGVGIRTLTLNPSPPVRFLALYDVPRHRVHTHALLGHPAHTSFDLLQLPFQLQDDPAPVLGDIGATDVGDDAKLLAQQVDEGLRHQLGGEGELD